MQRNTCERCSDFSLEALSDFPDDAMTAEGPISVDQVSSMMATLAGCGVRRVSWCYYGDGRGGHMVRDTSVKSQKLCSTYNLLGNPLRVAAEAAHEEGLKLHACFKPYETGAAHLCPEGSVEAAMVGRLSHLGGRLSWLDRFVVDSPHLRIKRRSDDLRADIRTVPICGLKLVKKDDSPTRVSKQHLQIWTSALNSRYQRLDIDFDVTENVEPAKKDVYDVSDELLTRKGDPVRTLTLSGFELNDPFILVTTDFSDGPPDFENTSIEMLVALDADGREVPGVFANGRGIWAAEMVDFRDWGLVFDHGWGSEKKYLDINNQDGQSGLVAYTRGRNEYLPGALCETEPQVREFWLSCIEEMLDAGVDGIDFREENHSTHTDYPEEYGFNPAVIEACEQRGGVDLATVAAVRGEAYTEFLRQAKQMIAARGKRMRINFQVDWYRPEPAATRRLAYPANLNFEWLRWIEEGLCDEGIIRFYHLPFDCIFNDEVTQEVIAACERHNISLAVNRYVRKLEPETLMDEYRSVRDDGRFSGFIMYETRHFVRNHPDGSCTVTKDGVDRLKDL